MLPKPRISLVRRTLYLLPAGAIFDSWSLCLQAASDSWMMSASDRLAALAMSEPAESRLLVSMLFMLAQPASSRLAARAPPSSFVLLFIMHSSFFEAEFGRERVRPAGARAVPRRRFLARGPGRIESSRARL